LVNYLGRMGWSMPDEREMFTFDEMVEAFDIERVSLGGPVFDQEKLAWLNGCWIREKLSASDFVIQLQKWLYNEEYIQRFLPFVQERCETFAQVLPLCAFMFSDKVSIEASDFTYKNRSEEETKKLLQFILWGLENLVVWEKERIFSEIKKLAETLDLPIKDLMQPVFVAIVGTPNSWSVVDSMEILGLDMSRARIMHAIQVLGGVSKKEKKRLEKAFSNLQ